MQCTNGFITSKKEKERRDIARDVETYLANGGIVCRDTPADGLKTWMVNWLLVRGVMSKNLLIFSAKFMLASSGRITDHDIYLKAIESLRESGLVFVKGYLIGATRKAEKINSVRVVSMKENECLDNEEGESE